MHHINAARLPKYSLSNGCYTKRDILSNWPYLITEDSEQNSDIMIDMGEST